MRDSRLIQMRECLAEAKRVADQQVGGLVRDCQSLLAEFDDEPLGVQQRIDVAQARCHLNVAAKYVAQAVSFVGWAAEELAELERK